MSIEVNNRYNEVTWFDQVIRYANKEKCWLSFLCDRLNLHKKYIFKGILKSFTKNKCLFEISESFNQNYLYKVLNVIYLKNVFYRIISIIMILLHRRVGRESGTPTPLLASVPRHSIVAKRSAFIS